MLFQIMGFWGDIVCSPYLSFGVDCEVPNKYAEGLFEILNKVSASYSRGFTVTD